MNQLERQIRELERRLSEVRHPHRHGLQRIVKDLRRAAAQGQDPQRLGRRISGVKGRMTRSIAERRWRMDHRPAPNFNTALPIFEKKSEILEAISSHPVVIISGETGSGKTTQIPQFCLAAGRGVDGAIGCTQPRRIAAVTVAQRIEEELGTGGSDAVGHKIRFADRTGKNTFVKIMTDGILLAEARRDRFLSAYDTIIVDEAHERSLNIDFILGILRTILPRRRDLKVIVTSATIDTEKFSRAFDDAPVIEVSGRLFPVEVRYQADPSGDETGEEATIAEQAARIAARIQKQSPHGDVLVFMPTEQDIRETCEIIEGGSRPEVQVLPLFSRLAGADQRKIFQTGRGRKIVVATNVAETSITIAGIRYVVDTGLARIPRYLPGSRTTTLPVMPISRSSADQRMGRCGRVQNGICYRLYSEEDYLSRPRFTPPEILRANLAEVILRMLDLDLGDIESFPFIDPPSAASLKDGYRLLVELGAIEENQTPGDVPTPAGAKRQRRQGQASPARYRLTRRGRLMASLPVDPRIARILIEAEKEGCIREVLVIAAALSISDPRERPADQAEAADTAHGRFRHPESDFLTLLRIWDAFAKARKTMGTGRIKRYCRQHFLSFRRMREWRDLHFQLAEEVKEGGLTGGKDTATKEKEALGNPDKDRYGAIHRAILSGFLSGIAVRRKKQIYQAARGREAMLFPGSSLFDKPPEWIVAAEMVETSRLFARTAARIDSRWLEPLGGSLCRRTHLAPHWERKRGQVVASEQVVLFGLIVVEDRRVDYGKIAPAEASDIFVRGALVEEDLKKPFSFMIHNRSLIERIQKMEDKFRRRDLLVSDEEVFSFYRQRIAETISDVRTFSRYLKQQGGDSFLEMTEEDLLLQRPDRREISRYPDRFDAGGRQFVLDYRFSPGSGMDGVTVRIPASDASNVPPSSLDWLVPGLFGEKVSALIRGLPKPYRRHLVPVADTVQTIVREMPRTEGSLTSALGEFIYRRFNLEIPASAWPDDALPEHLKMRIALVGPKGEEIRAGRDHRLLSGHAAGSVDSEPLAEARRRWERDDIESWDFGELPEEIALETGDGPAWKVYPGLQENDGRIDLRLFQDRRRAVEAHRQGVAALYRRIYKKDLAFFRRQIALPKAVCRLAVVLGGEERIEAQIFEKAFRQLFAENIRSKEAFEAHRETAAAELFHRGQKLLSAVVPVIEAAAEARSTLSDLEQASPGRPKILDFLHGLRKTLAGLVPDNFIALYDEKHIDHLPRYVSALTLRARRGVENLEKDRVKEASVLPFADGLAEMLESLSPSTTEAKRDAVEAFFWTLEEYKVSVFAQELGTAVPVSEKKMKKRLGEIRRMA